MTRIGRIAIKEGQQLSNAFGTVVKSGNGENDRHQSAETNLGSSNTKSSRPGIPPTSESQVVAERQRPSQIRETKFFFFTTMYYYKEEPAVLCHWDSYADVRRRKDRPGCSLTAERGAAAENGGENDWPIKREAAGKLLEDSLAGHLAVPWSCD